LARFGFFFEIGADALLPEGLEGQVVALWPVARQMEQGMRMIVDSAPTNPNPMASFFYATQNSRACP
jgi:hypothetical protein